MYDLLNIYCNFASIKKSSFAIRNELPFLSRLSRPCAQLCLQNVGVTPFVTRLMIREHIGMKTLLLFRDFFSYSEEPTIVFVTLSCVLQKHKFDRKAQQLYLTDGDI